MTNFTTKLMIAAATVVVAAGTASAQSMKAEVPFSFRVAGKTMPAGTYRIDDLNRTAAFSPYHIQNMETKDHVAVLPNGAKDPEKAWAANSKAVIAFDCSAGTCSLAAVYRPGSPEYTFGHSKLGKNESAALVLIDLSAVKGD